MSDEVNKLRTALIECGNLTGAYLSNEVTTEFLLGVPENTKLFVEEKDNKIEQLEKDKESLVDIVREISTFREGTTRYRNALTKFHFMLEDESK
jgi:hypothetical protein